MRILKIALLFVFSVVAFAQQQSAAQFNSGGVTINVDVITTSSPGNRPAVVFLYGSNGMTPAYLQMGRTFAQNGFQVFIIHYFDRTGTTMSTSSAAYTSYGPWLQTIRDGVGWAATQPGVDARNI